jgi:membrane fusion protein, heavy metal efflux system
MKSIAWIFVTLFAFGCGSKQETVKQEHEQEKVVTSDSTVQLTDAQMKIAGVATGTPEMKNIASVLKVNGKIDVPPQNIASISVPLGGYLRSSNLLPGMHIVKGQTLAIMEDPQYIQLQQDYLIAKAKLAYAEQEYNRQKELNMSKASSDKVFQQAQSEYSSQQILMQSLAEKLRLIHINPERLMPGNISRSIAVPSPISGFVSKVNVNVGKYVNPADALFEIVNPADIHLALDVFEKDVNKLFIGQPLVAYTNTNPDKKYPCKVLLISKDISDDKSFEVHCHFEKYDKDLLPGMFMNAEIEVESKNSYVLPSEAIVNFERKQFVFVEKGEKVFEIMNVMPEASENGFTAFDSVSQEKVKDKKVVIKGAYSLLMKMKNTAEE